MSKKHTIHAFHEDDTEKLFKKLEIWDDFTSGKMKCLICDEVLTFENLGALVPYKNEVCGACSPLCIYEAQKLVSQSSNRTVKK